MARGGREGQEEARLPPKPSKTQGSQYPAISDRGPPWAAHDPSLELALKKQQTNEGEDLGRSYFKLFLGAIEMGL